MAKANLDRTVAEALMRAYQADYGPAGSNPSLQSTVTSETVVEQLGEMGMQTEHDTVVSILRGLAAQDYIGVKPGEEEGTILVEKVYPARMKRDFNLWHVAEDWEG
jgi:hypothetical protein